MPEKKTETKNIRIPLEIVCGERTCGKCMFIYKLLDPPRVSCLLFDTLLNFKPEWGDVGEIYRCNECLDVGRNISD